MHSATKFIAGHSDVMAGVLAVKGERLYLLVLFLIYPQKADSLAHVCFYIRSCGSWSFVSIYKDLRFYGYIDVNIITIGQQYTLHGVKLLLLKLSIKLTKI